MPPKEKAAPLPDAPLKDHKKHAAEFLAIEDYKDPKKVNKANYEDKYDEAKS